MLESGMYIANRYEIVGKVGVGGMADVYKAKDATLDRYVAIKVLKQEFCEDMNFVTKFRTEAQSAASLEHPNIVNIYDVGSENGIYYIVMEYVEGITLKEYIQKKGKLSYKETLSIAIQVSRGIQAAHEKGIIHRDIKPQNIIISTDGKVKVTDFGIARAASTNTIHSDVMGSVHYASPEQARNGYVSDKSDIYSLGIVMYEMVTGKVPFDGDSTVQIAIQHLQDEMVSPRAYAQNLPVSLEKIILKCTQKNPDRRYENIEELLIDLRRSLVSPNTDFVSFAPVADGATRVISEKELKEIQNQTEGVSPEHAAPVETREQYSPVRNENTFDPEEDAKASRKEKLITTFGIIGVVVIVIIFLLILGNIFGWFRFGSKNNTAATTQTSAVSEQTGESDSKKEDTVTMIDLKGMTYSQAKSQLESMGLKINQKSTEASEEYDKNEIISQDVSEGDSVKKGTTINVVVSTGKQEEEIDVPNVVGSDASDAETLLENAGFVVKKKFDYSSTVDSGDVISQTPKAGKTAYKNDTVTITISQGMEKIKVPDVIGMSQSEAQSALKAKGLKYTVVKDYSDDYDQGDVIAQSEKASTYVDSDTTIKLTVSKGPKTVKYTYTGELNVPDLNEDQEVKYASVSLYDGNGTVVKYWSKITDFPYTLTATNIENSSSGVRKATFYFTDGTSHTYSSNVSFRKSS